MGDVRRAQQQGWVTRAFGPVQAITLPSTTTPDERVVEISYPDSGSEMGGLFLTSLFKTMGCEWELPSGGRYARGGVYRLLVGKAAITAWVDLPLKVMTGRIGYWPTIDRVVGVIEHPDSILASGKGKQAKIKQTTEFMRAWGEVVRGEVPAIDVMARDCVKCADDGMIQTYVTEIDQMGLGLCRRHGGWDVRPEGQRWSQERMF